MIRPGMLAVLAPCAVGLGFRVLGFYTGQALLGAKAVAGLLMFSMVAGAIGSKAPRLPFLLCGCAALARKGPVLVKQGSMQDALTHYLHCIKSLKQNSQYKNYIAAPTVIACGLTCRYYLRSSTSYAHTCLWDATKACTRS